MAFDDILRFTELDPKERRVFVRADLDVALTPTGRMTDDRALRRLVPLLRALSTAGCKVVVAWHAERRDAALFRGISDTLARLLERPVRGLGRGFAEEIAGLRPGQVALTPNLSLFAEELRNDVRWARRIARSIDVYVNEAPAASRSERASTVALPRLMPARAPGPLLDSDLAMTRDFVFAVDGPFVALVGGRDLARKANFIRSLCSRIDTLLLGGVLGNTFLVASGWSPRASAYESDAVALAAELTRFAHAQGVRVVMPEDCLTLTREGAFERRGLEELGEHEALLDLGTHTTQAYAAALKSAVTLLWNGSLGERRFAETLAGTRAVVDAGLAAASFTGVVGEDSVELARELGLVSRFRSVGASGSASVAVVSGESSPGIEALRQRAGTPRAPLR